MSKAFCIWVDSLLFNNRSMFRGSAYGPAPAGSVACQMMTNHSGQSRTRQTTLALGEFAQTLPSAKPRSRLGPDSRPWGKFLAAFSEAFAESAISLICGKTPTVLYDPFVGSGTTLVSAAKLGITAVGNDLDPFSAVISRARIASNYNPERVLEILEPHPVAIVKPFAQAAELDGYFCQGDLSYAAAVFTKIKASVPSGNEQLLSTLLADHSGSLDSAAIALAAILVAGSASAKMIRGSNPVWHRKARPGERTPTKPLHAAAVARASGMMRDIDHQGFQGERRIKVMCDNSLQSLLPQNSVDAILTSPPYLNRLDFVVDHLPQLLLLSCLHHVDIDTLRRRMVGTTKIIQKIDVDERVGPTCISLIKQIRDHPGYASRRYYQYIYVQYFNDMLKALDAWRTQCKSGARGIMVVQTSYYKDLLIDSPRIFGEMANLLGFRITPLASEEVTMHYGNLSPRQLKYVPGKRLREWVLLLEF
jgi:DNA modification methylase